MYSTAADATLKAFAVPTPESTLAEAASQAHGGLYWEDKTDPDGSRTRHFFPNDFNKFWHECLLDPLYRMIVWSRGTALKAVGDSDADRYFAEGEMIERQTRNAVE